MTGYEYNHINDVIEDLYEKGNCTEEDYDFLCNIVDKADRYDKYKWHDLRKDDMDMPFDGRMVLWKLDNGHYFTDWVENDKLCLSDCEFGLTEHNSRIIAWKEIEEFEEGGTE